MFGSKHITRKARRALTIGLLAASFAAPAAHANGGLVDDWFRNQQVVPMASIGLIDVTAKESSRPIAVPQIITPTQAGNAFAWGEFGIGAGAMLGLVLIAGALVLGAGSLRHRGSTLRTS